jgi:hypothetical protein
MVLAGILFTKGDMYRAKLPCQAQAGTGHPGFFLDSRRKTWKKESEIKDHLFHS